MASSTCMTLCGKQAEGEQKDSSGAEAPFSPQTGRNSGTLACNLPLLATWATPSISLIKTDYSKRLLLLSDILVHRQRFSPLSVRHPSSCPSPVIAKPLQTRAASAQLDFRAMLTWSQVWHNL